MTDCVLCGLAVESNRPDAIYCEYRCHAELMAWVWGFGGADPHSVIWSGDRAGDGGWLNGEVTCCYLCGEMPTDVNPTNVEHVYPSARGGDDELTNVGMACRRCNSVKGAKLIELTEDQTQRLAAQQSAFATRYADMKAHLPSAVLQASSDCLWDDNGFDDDVDGFENGDAWLTAGAQAVVQAVSFSARNVHVAHDGLAARCRTYGIDILRLYVERGWFGNGSFVVESALETEIAAELERNRDIVDLLARTDQRS